MTLSTDYTFGVEIEFKGANLSDVAAALTASGVSARTHGYGDHTPLTHWKLVTDATVTTGDYNYRAGRGFGGELVSPILRGEDGLRKLSAALDALNAIEGVHVDAACGIHVHLGKVGGWTTPHAKNIYLRYAAFEAEFDSFMPRSRRGSNSRYCGSLTGYASRISGAVDGHLHGVSGLGGGKFMKVNLTTLMRGDGTIEFRHHAGSTDFVKISNWVKLLVAFADKSETTAPSGTASASFRPVNRGKVYAAIREQVALHGGEMRFAGGQYWQITTADGTNRRFDIDRINRCYAGFDTDLPWQQWKARQWKLNSARFTEFWNDMFPQNTSDSMFAGVAGDVVEFFQRRTAHFAAQ